MRPWEVSIEGAVRTGLPWLCLFVVIQDAVRIRGNGFGNEKQAG